MYGLMHVGHGVCVFVCVNVNMLTLPYEGIVSVFIYVELREKIIIKSFGFTLKMNTIDKICDT